MKLLHLSDLHLGKRVNEYSMLEDQQYILDQILDLIRTEQPDAVLIAGDIYDKPVPSAEAVTLFDRFLVALSHLDLHTFVISGNHDSPERIAFGGRLMEHSGVHLSPVYDGRVSPITLTDAFGPVDFYLLPFLKPAHVRRFFPDTPIQSYSDALKTAVDAMHPSADRRSVLLTHQFVTGAACCDSEELSVGGSDNVDAAVFAPFDYVALGHLHGPQSVSRDTLRYCGSPLKYSFSEARHKKSVTLVELGAKGSVSVRTLPLTPLRDLKELKGSYDALTRREFYQGTDYPNAYLHITLTDEEDIPDAAAKLRILYPYLMKLDYDNQRTRANAQILALEDLEQQSPLALFEAFYKQQNNQPMGEVQRDFIRGLIETIWEEDTP